uniref:Uncharacterized protein n=1 Tax=Rhizophora mucronata TaxID=61149 RepID=A0A2P2N6C6_RHIMU
MRSLEHTTKLSSFTPRLQLFQIIKISCSACICICLKI